MSRENGPRMRKNVIRQSAALTVALSFCFSGNISKGEVLDDLKGLSIHAVYSLHIKGYIPDDNRYFTATPRRTIRLYVSAKGNVFDYEHVVGGPNNSLENKSVIMSGAERAVQLSQGGSLAAWTMKDGHLTKIVKLLAGFGITTISVDPTRLTCTATHVNQPDVQTNVIWLISPITNRPTLIRESRMDSSTCTAIRGNTFAADQ